MLDLGSSTCNVHAYSACNCSYSMGGVGYADAQDTFQRNGMVPTPRKRDMLRTRISTLNSSEKIQRLFTELF